LIEFVMMTFWDVHTLVVVTAVESWSAWRQQTGCVTV